MTGGPAWPMSVLTSEPFNPMLSQQLHDTLARAVELTETFEAQNRYPSMPRLAFAATRR